MGFLGFKRKPVQPVNTEKNRSSQLDDELKRLNDELASQDKQLQLIQAAEEKYKDDVDSLISFWENLWKTSGLLFNGSTWTFRLPDIYVSLRRYDDALHALTYINKPQYEAKRQAYIERVRRLKTK